jgi:NAD(P)H-flavin reductase
MENEWLREAIQFSLKASISPTSDHGRRRPPPQGDNSRQKLIDGILYSRRFILTYHVIVLGFLVLSSVLQWTRKAIRWRKRMLRRQSSVVSVAGIEDTTPIKTALWTGKEIAKTFEDVSSSGSSTIEGTASPPRKHIDEDEETPLLPRGTTTYSPRRSALSSIEAFLMYQPRPIPFFNKTLPSNGSSIFILCFLGLNLFYSLFHLEFSVGYIFVIADRFGLVFVANLPLLYLLAAKNQPLNSFTGRSYESLNIFHRRLGELLCLEAFLHGVGMTIVWYTLIRPNGYSFLQYLLLPVIFLGLGAFFAYEFLYFTSLGSFRQRWYELFLGLHIFLQVAALVFVFFHHKAGQPYVGIALGIFLIDRLVYRLGAKSIMVKANANVMEDGETVKLSMAITPRSGFKFSGLFGKSIVTGWSPTDHVFVTVSALGREHILQAHPFTISSAAPTSKDEEANLELLIRAQSGFSKYLLGHVQRHNTLTLRLDGPYGSTHARQLLEDSDLALVVAGGSGIAVAWPLIKHLLHVSGSRDVEIPGSNDIRKQKIVLIWVVHKASHMSWLPKHDLEMSKSKGVEIVTPPATDEAGRPNLGGMITGIIEKFANGERRKTGVVASGPDSMGRLVRNTCAGLVREGMDVDVTIEKFGW